MSFFSFRKLPDPHSLLDDHVERLWEWEADPVLVCSLRVDYAISGASREVDVIITSREVTIRYRALNPLLSSHMESTIRAEHSPQRLSAQLQSLGVFHLGSAERSMYDGGRATIAVKGPSAKNVFSERSIDTPQARIRDTLLALATEEDSEQEEERRGAEKPPPPSDSEMTFIVTTPKPRFEESPIDA